MPFMKNTDLYPGISLRIPGIEKLKEEIESDYVETNPKDSIYHYTDADGLLG